VNIFNKDIIVFVEIFHKDKIQRIRNNSKTKHKELENAFRIQKGKENKEINSLF